MGDRDKTIFGPWSIHVIRDDLTLARVSEDDPCIVAVRGEGFLDVRRLPLNPQSIGCFRAFEVDVSLVTVIESNALLPVLESKNVVGGIQDSTEEDDLTVVDDCPLVERLQNSIW